MRSLLLLLSASILTINNSVLSLSRPAGPTIGTLVPSGEQSVPGVGLLEGGTPDLGSANVGQLPNASPLNGVGALDESLLVGAIEIPKAADLTTLDQQELLADVQNKLGVSPTDLQSLDVKQLADASVLLDVVAQLSGVKESLVAELSVEHAKLADIENRKDSLHELAAQAQKVSKIQKQIADSLQVLPVPQLFAVLNDNSLLQSLPLPQELLDQLLPKLQLDSVLDTQGISNLSNEELTGALDLHLNQEWPLSLVQNALKVLSDRRSLQNLNIEDKNDLYQHVLQEQNERLVQSHIGNKLSSLPLKVQVLNLSENPLLRNLPVPEETVKLVDKRSLVTLTPDGDLIMTQVTRLSPESVLNDKLDLPIDAESQQILDSVWSRNKLSPETLHGTVPKVNGNLTETIGQLPVSRESLTVGCEALRQESSQEVLYSNAALALKKICNESNV